MSAGDSRVGEIYRRYLSDGVYASYDGEQIWLRADRDGICHEIALDSNAYVLLLEYVRILKEMNKRQWDAR